MIKLLTTLLLALFGCANILFSQINIDGDILLGDSTQVLVLETRNGDQFLGRLLSWSESEVMFQLQTDDLLTYNAEDVISISVLKKVHTDPAIEGESGEFAIHMNSGLYHEAQLLSWNPRTVKVKMDGRHRLFYDSNKIVRIDFRGERSYWKYENSYVLRLKDGGKRYGRLKSMSKSALKIESFDGKTEDFRLSEVKRIRFKRAYRPMYGYRRALLLTPTGFNLRKGEGEFRTIDYIHNSYALGITDHVSGTVGLMGVEPYIQLKAAYDFSKYIHIAGGGGISLGGARGWFSAASIGSPDYYFNFGYMKNKGNLNFANTDMDAMFFGASLRVGNRRRLIGEFTHLTEQGGLFDANGYGTNTFALAYGWFGRRISLNAGIILVENSNEDFCFGSGGGIFFGPCDMPQYYFSSIPVISTSIMLGKRYK